MHGWKPTPHCKELTPRESGLHKTRFGPEGEVPHKGERGGRQWGEGSITVT